MLIRALQAPLGSCCTIQGSSAGTVGGSETFGMFLSPLSPHDTLRRLRRNGESLAVVPYFPIARARQMAQGRSALRSLSAAAFLASASLRKVTGPSFRASVSAL